MIEWIKKSEKLPEQKDIYLVTWNPNNSGETVYLAFYFGNDSWCIHPTADDLDSFGVTHWAYVNTPNEIVNLDNFVGLKEKEAEETFKNGKKLMRVAKRDGKSFPLTAEFMSDRVNVEIENGVVSQILSIG